MPPRRLFAFLLLVLAASFAVPAGVFAQADDEAPSGETAEAAEEGPSAEDMRADRLEQEARTLFEAGRMAFADGRFDDALASFQRAFTLSNRPVLLFNIGTSLDRLQQKAEAITAFENYLERIPDAHNRAEVESRLTALRASVAEDEAQAARLREEEERRLALEAQLAANESPPLYERWWFWTIIGVLIVGGAVTAGILLYDPGVAEPQLGSTGQVTFTLGGP